METATKDEARLFWVVDSPELNEEIFATKHEAVKYAEKFGKQAPYRIFIAEVRNYFWETYGSWNYDDQADTFSPIITVVMQNDTRKRHQYKGYEIVISDLGYETTGPNGDFAYSYDGTEPELQLLEMAKADIDNN